MKTFDDLTKTQQDAVDWLYEHDATLLDGKMGGGKTICTLTAAGELLADDELERVLVVAPLKVARTVWQEEAADWEHTQHLKVAKCVGDEKERMAALASDAQIVVVNFDNLIWLCDLLKDGFYASFDGLVIDELTKLKTAGGKQFKALRPRLKQFKWRVGLTGTAVSENWEGLYAMMLILDSGKRLGTRKDAYMQRFFYQTDFQGYKHELHPWAAKAISELIDDVVYSMPDYRDELIEPLYEKIEIEMPQKLRDIYEEMKGKMVVDIDGELFEAPNAAVLSGKLQQISSGFMYVDDEERTPVDISEYRHDALMGALAESEGPTLVVYWYKADLEMIKAMLPEAVELNSGKGVEANVAAWNRGEIDNLLVHPQSAGHGLNLAKGGHEIIWFTPTWSRDLYEQTNARLWRRGQTEQVRIREIVCRGSIDELVIQRVQDKAEFEALWSRHLAGGSTAYICNQAL